LITSNAVRMLNGNLSRIVPSRTFVDGQLFREVSVVDGGGRKTVLRGLFCTNRLLEFLTAPGAKVIYVWNRHVFAVERDGGLIEDIEGVRNSFLYRDRFLLMMLAGSIVMLPYVTWVVIKKLMAIGSLPRLRGGRGAP
jgi:hypothetical protein